MDFSMILTVAFTLMAYGAGAVFIIGFVSKLVKYARTPSPLKIPSTPAPINPIGSVFRLLGDVIFFRNLFKGNKWTWIGGMVFHYAFLFIVIRHLRYFLYPVAGWDMDLQDVGIYAGIVLPIAVVYLLMRRTTVDRTMFISSLADYFALALIFSIAVTGLTMKFYVRPYMVDVKGFVYGLVTLHWVSVPAEPMFLLHLLLVFMLLAYFPFSKLMHAGGLLFSPTRHQCDNPREKRHVNPWAPNLSS